ncbi:MAG: response regulator [Lentisphaerae bacterium]|nr:response regulator [Lentisphaerota bacterium]
MGHHIVYLSIVAVLTAGAAVAVFLLFSLRKKAGVEVAEACRKAHEAAAREAFATGQAEAASFGRSWLEHALAKTREIVLAYEIAPDNVPGPYVFASDMACEALGFARDELLKLSPRDIEVFRSVGVGSASADVKYMSLNNTSALATGGAYAMRGMEVLVNTILRDRQTDYEGGFLCKNGRLLSASIMAVRVDFAGRPRVLCFARDLSEQSRREAEAHERERLLKDLVTNSATGVVLLDAGHAVRQVNAACLRMFGCPDDREFRKVKLLESRFFPESAKEKLARGETFVCEVAFDFDAARREALFATTRQGLCHFEIHVTNLGVERGLSSRGVLLQVLDITAQRNAEREAEQMEESLRQARKLEAIGTLAGGIAHDFNNILTPILGYAELGQDLCEEGSPLRGFLNEIMQASLRAKELVEQILVFSRRGERTTKPMRIGPIIKEVSKQIAASAPESVRVNCSIRTTADRVLAMPTHIHQILMNLCSNAVYVMKKNGGGTLDISMTGFVLSHIHKKEFPTLTTRAYLRGGEQKRFLRLTVTDTGPGMDEATLARIFEPFFTTKPSGEGTGMGLALVQGIVTTLGGAIRVETAPGAGTSFHVAIPIAEEKKEDQTQQTGPVVSGSARVLFVDDETAIVQMAEKMLQSLGYEPVVTNRSVDALNIFRRDPDMFDIVVTDQVMPEMTGAELTRELLGVRPDLPIVLCTGFSERFPREKAEEAGIREFVMKPIVRRDLALAIERALGRTTDHV